MNTTQWQKAEPENTRPRMERKYGEFSVVRFGEDRGRHISYAPFKAPVYTLAAFVEAPAGQDPDAYADKYIETFLIPATKPFIIES